MAIAYHASTITTYAARTNTTTTAPAITNGDILLIFFVIGSNGAATAATPPTGFTPITGFPSDQVSSTFWVRTYAWYKIANNESGNYTITHTSASTQAYLGSYSGGNTTTPFSPNPTVNTGTGTTSTALAVTTTVANTLIIYAGHDWGDTTNNLVPPAGTTPTFTERADTPISYVADGILATPGSTGNKTQTNNSVSGIPWTAALFALPPAATTSAKTLTDNGAASDALSSSQTAVTYRHSTITTYTARTNTTATAPTVANGDTILIFFVIGSDGTATSATPPAGFNIIPGFPSDQISSTFWLRTYAWYKTANNESGNYTITHAAASTQAYVGTYSGANTTTPFDPNPTINTGLGSTSTALSITTTTPNCLIIYAGHDWGDTSNDLTPPAGTTPTFVERADTTISYIADGLLTNAGSTGDKTQTNNSAFGIPWTAVLFALSPGGTSTSSGKSLVDAGAATDAITGLPQSIDPVGQAAGTWTLVFNENFDSGFDTNTWATHLIEGDAFRTNDNPSEIQWYSHNNAGIVVSGGYLTLIARREDPRNAGSVGYDPLCPNTLVNGNTPQYSSGMIQSHPKFQLSYGYLESRIRLAAVDGSNPSNVNGSWPAFWTIASDAAWPPEFDIYEYFGTGNYIAENYFFPAGGQTSHTVGGVTGWHISGLAWTPTSAHWYLDGTEIYAYTGSITNLPQHIIFNFAVQTDAAATRMDVAIDYIRAWTPVGIPATPTVTSVSKPTGTSMRIDYQAVSGATGYRAIVCPVDAEADGLNTSRSAAVPPVTGTGTTLTVSGLTSGARYQIMVSAYNAIGYSPESVPASEGSNPKLFTDYATATTSLLTNQTKTLVDGGAATDYIVNGKYGYGYTAGGYAHPFTGAKTLIDSAVASDLLSNGVQAKYGYGFTLGGYTQSTATVQALTDAGVATTDTVRVATRLSDDIAAAADQITTIATAPLTDKGVATDQTTANTLQQLATTGVAADALTIGTRHQDSAGAADSTITNAALNLTETVLGVTALNVLQGTIKSSADSGGATDTISTAVTESFTTVFDGGIGSDSVTIAVAIPRVFDGGIAADAISSIKLQLIQDTATATERLSKTRADSGVASEKLITTANIRLLVDSVASDLLTGITRPVRITDAGTATTSIVAGRPILIVAENATHIRIIATPGTLQIPVQTGNLRLTVVNNGHLTTINRPGTVAVDYH